MYSHTCTLLLNISKLKIIRDLWFPCLVKIFVLVFWVVTQCELEDKIMCTIPTSLAAFYPLYFWLPGLLTPLTPLHSPPIFSFHPATFSWDAHSAVSHYKPSVTFILDVGNASYSSSFTTFRDGGLVSFSSSPSYTLSLILLHFSPQTTLLSPVTVTASLSLPFWFVVWVCSILLQTIFLSSAHPLAPFGQSPWPGPFSFS